MPVSVTFDYAAWSLLYPELVPHCDASQAQGMFNKACGFIPNIRDLTVQANALNAATAHFAALFIRRQRDPETAFAVGPISGGGQGSTSVQFGSNASAASAFWKQTQYGDEVWELTKAYRSAVYIPGPKRRMEPGPYPR
jgi:hypothetical protein